MIINSNKIKINNFHNNKNNNNIRITKFSSNNKLQIKKTIIYKYKMKGNNSLYLQYFRQRPIIINSIMINHRQKMSNCIKISRISSSTQILTFRSKPNLEEPKTD